MNSQRAPITDPTRPAISIVVPAWHEEATIGTLVRHVRRLDERAQCELIVVDGDPAGSTLAVIDDARVVGLLAEKGRASQMNAGAAVAGGRVLLFLHADTRLPPTAVDDIRRATGERGAVCGAFGLRFDSPRLVYRVMSWAVTALTRLNRLPFGDQAIFIDRELFDEMGGYANIPVMEDVELVRRVSRAGHRVFVCPSKVRTSCRRMEAEGIFRRVCKNKVMMILYSLGVSPRRLSRWYTDDHRRGSACEASSGSPAGPSDAP